MKTKSTIIFLIIGFFSRVEAKESEDFRFYTIPFQKPQPKKFIDMASLKVLLLKEREPLEHIGMGCAYFGVSNYKNLLFSLEDLKKTMQEPTVRETWSELVEAEKEAADLEERVISVLLDEVITCQKRVIRNKAKQADLNRVLQATARTIYEVLERCFEKSSEDSLFFEAQKKICPINYDALEILRQQILPNFISVEEKPAPKEPKISDEEFEKICFQIDEEARENIEKTRLAMQDRSKRRREAEIERFQEQIKSFRKKASPLVEMVTSYGERLHAQNVHHELDLLKEAVSKLCAFLLDPGHWQASKEKCWGDHLKLSCIEQDVRVLAVNSSLNHTSILKGALIHVEKELSLEESAPSVDKALLKEAVFMTSWCILEKISAEVRDPQESLWFSEGYALLKEKFSFAKVDS